MILLPYPISANRYWRNIRGRMIVSPEAKAWKREVAQEYKFSGKGKFIVGHAHIELIYHPKATKNGSASKTRLDLDNVLKVVIDAMQGVAYLNDNQIVSISARVGDAIKNGGLSFSVMAI